MRNFCNGVAVFQALRGEHRATRTPAGQAKPLLSGVAGGAFVSLVWQAKLHRERKILLARAAHPCEARDSPPRGGTLLLHHLLADLEQAGRDAPRDALRLLGAQDGPETGFVRGPTERRALGVPILQISAPQLSAQPPRTPSRVGGRGQGGACGPEAAVMACVGVSAMTWNDE